MSISWVWLVGRGSLACGVAPQRAQAIPCTVVNAAEAGDTQFFFGTRGKAELRFHCHETLRRMDKLGDLFAPVLTLKQKLPKSEEA